VRQDRRDAALIGGPDLRRVDEQGFPRLGHALDDGGFFGPPRRDAVPEVLGTRVDALTHLAAASLRCRFGRGYFERADFHPAPPKDRHDDPDHGHDGSAEHESQDDPCPRRPILSQVNE
jgi:hypothetical protein